MPVIQKTPLIVPHLEKPQESFRAEHPLPTTNMTPVLEFMKQDMVQSVVHDLRTPITVVKGYLQLLLSGVMGSLSSEQMQLLQQSVPPLEDLILMTENLLQSISLQNDGLELNRSEIDVNRLLAETIEFYRLPFQQRGIRIYQQGTTVRAGVLADTFWIRRVLNNLIWNAFKFTPDGGEVTLHIRHRGNGIEIGVQDTGRGISPERIDRLFQKFEQADPTHDRKQGSGLGLWICKRILDLHDGWISVSSVQGRGTRFSFWLPSPPPRAQGL